jgi:hypothetical protein
MARAPIEVIEMVWTASVRTVMEAGPLPDRIEDMREHTAKHYRLMRSCDPRLNALTDAEIGEIMSLEDEDL